MRKTRLAMLTMVALFTFTGMNIGCAVANDVDSKNSQVKARKDQRRKRLTFVLKDGSKKQTLIVEPISRSKINFVLSIDGPCKKSVSGVAVGGLKGDPENEEDESGTMYPAIAYTFEGKDGYILGISIALKKDKAIVAEDGDKSGCPVIVKTMNIVK